MTRVTFMYDNLWDGAALTASSQNPNFLAINTQHRWHTRTWRSFGGGGTLTENIVADMGSAVAVQAFALKNHNFSPSAAVRIQANASNSWGSPSVDVSVPLATDLLAYFWGTPQSYQWWRLSVVDSAPVTTYLEIGRLFVGPYFSPSINISIGYKRHYSDPSDVLYSDGGQIVTNQKTRFQNLDLQFQYLSDVDIASFDAMFLNRGIGKEFFYTRDRDLPLTSTMYVRLKSEPEITHVYDDNIFNLNISLEIGRAHV